MTQYTLPRTQGSTTAQWLPIISDKRCAISPYELPQPNTWVKLLELPNPFSYDEALLLCQKSSSEWVAWIPDHGEAILNIRQFC